MDIERELLEQDLAQAKADLRLERAARRRYHYVCRHIERLLDSDDSTTTERAVAELVRGIRRFGERGE